MSNFEEARAALLRRVLEGEGKASFSDRRAAFDLDALRDPLRQLAENVANSPRSITDEDTDKLKRSGLSEDQIFEVVVCAAIGQASRQYESAVGTLEKVRNEHAAPNPE